MKRWLALAGAAALIAGGATLVSTTVATAENSSSPTATNGTDRDDPLRQRLKDKLRDRFGGMHRMMGGVLHGELTISDGDGGYRTVLVQRGTATSVSADSITVRSADGFSMTYDVTGDTVVHNKRKSISGIAKGAQVHVLAKEVDGEAIATRIADITALLKQRDELHGPGMAPGAGMPGMQPGIQG